MQNIKKFKKQREIEQKSGESRNERPNPYKPNLVKCKIDNCGKYFTTIFGLIQHKKRCHLPENIENNLETCRLCGKEVIYIDKHLQAVHKDVVGEKFVKSL